MRKYALGAIVACLFCEAAPAASLFFFPGNGQSLALGVGQACGPLFGNPPWICSTAGSTGNLMPTRDANFYRTTTPLISLAEVGQSGNATANDYESVATSIANQIHSMAVADADLTSIDMAASYGISGVPYSSWKKGGSAGSSAGYAKQLLAMQNMPAAVLAAGYSYYLPASWVIGGESDFSSQHRTGAQWFADMVAHQANVQADSGQAGALVPLAIGQSAGWNSFGACAFPTTTCLRDGTPGTPLGVNTLFESHYSDGTMIVYGPQYQYTYYNVPHPIPNQRATKPTEQGYREMGAKIGEAIYNVAFRKTGWKPVYPKSITRAGTTVTMMFFTQSQLALDTTSLVDRTDCGFEVIDSGDATTAILGSGTCAAQVAAGHVVVAGVDTVNITLNHAPTGTLEVLYAYTPLTTIFPGGATGQANNGAWGNLRNSNPTRSWSNPASGTQTVFLYDWALMFRKSVGFSLTLAEPTNLAQIPGPGSTGGGGGGSGGGCTCGGKSLVGGTAIVQ